MYPAGKKDQPVDYSGDRSIESFVEFIKEKGTHGIEVSLVEGLHVQEQGQAAPAATPTATERAQETVETATEKAKGEVTGEDPKHDEL